MWENHGGHRHSFPTAQNHRGSRPLPPGCVNYGGHRPSFPTGERRTPPSWDGENYAAPSSQENDRPPRPSFATGENYGGRCPAVPTGENYGDAAFHS